VGGWVLGKVYFMLNEIIDTVKAIEDRTKKEINFISFYKTGEVKEITFTIVDLLTIGEKTEV